MRFILLSGNLKHSQRMYRYVLALSAVINTPVENASDYVRFVRVK